MWVVLSVHKDVFASATQVSCVPSKVRISPAAQEPVVKLVIAVLPHVSTFGSVSKPERAENSTAVPPALTFKTWLAAPV